MTTFKRWPGWDNMHFDKCLGTDEENYLYCKGPYEKNGKSKPLNPTFWETGERISMGRKGARNDLKDIEDDIKKGLTYEEICAAHFDTVAKYHKFIKERVQAHATQKELDSLHEALRSASLRPWQKALAEIVEEDPNPRTIHWIWCENGNSGKSWMTKYMAAMYSAVVLDAGRKTDMAYIYAKADHKKVVVFDLSRTMAPSEEDKYNKLDAAYSLAESIKNGMVISTKYDSTTVLTNGSHVIFFANFPPDMTKWSADRYNIIKILPHMI